jgi:hypothetical protein
MALLFDFSMDDVMFLVFENYVHGLHLQKPSSFKKKNRKLNFCVLHTWKRAFG